MTRVYYMVGRDGYETRCNTYESAMKQKASDPGYVIRTCYEKIERPQGEVSDKRKELISSVGYVPKAKFGI